AGNIPLLVVSGLPASGKSTLSRKLAPALNLSLIDKDEILEGLFGALGIGDSDWRKQLSRASDEILRRLATSSSGAVVTSFWRHQEMPVESGTPRDWVTAASQRVVEVYCVCDPEIAATRFVNRLRHPGHLDRVKQREEEVLSTFKTLSSKGPLR